MKRITILVVVCLVWGCAPSISEKHAESTAVTTIVKLGVENNHLSKEWVEAIRKRESSAYLDSISLLERALTEDEIDWMRLIESVSEEWNLMRDSLGVPFKDIAPDDTTFILLGYMGTDDGFTFENQTLCFDLTALLNNYGKAQDESNKNRIMRLMSHEYTHLLSKKWMKKNDFQIPENHFESDSAFRKHVLWEIWYEGLGIYRSMSAKWFPVGDSLSPIADKTLEKLSQDFVEKMITMDTSKRLTMGQKKWIQDKVSDGPFNQKYAALPIGIWLAMEAKGDDSKLIKWVDAGPEGILALPIKYLKGESKRKFEKVFNDRFN